MAVKIRALRAWLLAGALGACSAGFALGQGDGSFTDNPDLLRGSFSPFCEPAMLCSYADAPPTTPAPPAVNAAEPLALIAPSPPAQYAPPVPEPAPAPYEATHQSSAPSSPWRASYGIALRGSFIHSQGANRYEAQLIPNAGLRYVGEGTAASLAASATLVQPLGGELRLGGATLEADLAHALGPSTRLDLGAALTLEQSDPQGLDAADAPLRLDADLDAALTQRMGQWELTGSLGAGRTLSGDDLADADRNSTRLSGGMRLGYELTPILTVFVAGDAGYEAFDAADPVLGESRSGWAYAARAGFVANWNDTMSFEASAGSGWRRFDAAGLSESQALLYGAALEYSPDPALRLRAALDTAIVPGSGAVLANIDHTLSLEVAYRINQWLGLRGSASGAWSEAQGTGDLVRRYGAGLGADIALGPHSDLALDYAYGWRGDPASTPAEADEHRVSAGVSLQY